MLDRRAIEASASSNSSDSLDVLIPSDEHLVVTDSPDSWWCPSLGPMAPNNAPWRCVLDLEHEGIHKSAGDPTWLTADETGRTAPTESQD